MTIKDVAGRAGVSPAAVSRYINGGSLSPEKRERIRKVIEETGYRPSASARIMRTGRGGLIGVIVPRIHSDSVSQIIAGISSELSAHGYLSMLGSTQENREMEPEYISMMQDNQVEGIILMGTVMSPRLADVIRVSTKPIVVTGQCFEGIPCVYHDDFNAVRELMVRMLRRGRKNIVYIGVLEEDEAAGRQRTNGALAAWREAGFEPDTLPVMTAQFSPESGRQCMEEILRRYPEVDGVVCATDRIALGAMDAIRRAGKHIPDDISIAGVGDSWAGSFTSPQLTTAHLYYQKCGQSAAKMLLERIEGRGSLDDAAVTQIMLSYTIYDRRSL